jgi:HPt (histidine-containing phosphotransfer) domain-containing protein
MARCYDHEQAMRATGGDRELLAELLTMFRQESSQMLAKMDNAITNSDVEALTQAAHAIKGALAHLGATTARELAFTIETNGRQSKIEGAAELLAQLIQEVKAFEKVSETVTAQLELKEK